MKRRVLLVACNNLNKGGIQSVIMSIVRNLSEEYIFDVVCFDNKKSFYEDEFKMYGGVVHRIPFYQGDSSFRRRLDFYIRPLYIWHSIKRILCAQEYSVIHCHNGLESGLWLKLAKRRGIPIRLVHSHTAYPTLYKINKIRLFYELIYHRIMMKNATGFVGCSEEANRNLFDGNVGQIINNIVDLDYYCQEKYENKRRNNSLSIVQVGLFSDNKNQLFSIEIIKELKKKYPEVKLYLVGRIANDETEMYFRRVQQSIRLFKCEQNIEIIQQPDFDIPNLLSQSSYFLMPSKYEGFGTVAIEAQAMGLKGFISDSVPKTTNVGGCYFLPLDKGAKFWASTIDEKYKNDHGCHEKYDLSKFSSDVVIEGYRKLYCSC